MAGNTIRDLITVREAARECHRAMETVRRWIWEGKLPAQKLGNQLFIKRADLARAAMAKKQHRVEEELALLEKIRILRERIARRTRKMARVLEALDESRESHP